MVTFQCSSLLRSLLFSAGGAGESIKPGVSEVNPRIKRTKKVVAQEVGGSIVVDEPSTLYHPLRGLPIHLALLSWALRPRLYAIVRSADSPAHRPVIS